jgi:hypothetical protein
MLQMSNVGPLAVPMNNSGNYSVRHNANDKDMDISDTNSKKLI